MKSIKWRTKAVLCVVCSMIFPSVAICGEVNTRNVEKDIVNMEALSQIAERGKITLDWSLITQPVSSEVLESIAGEIEVSYEWLEAELEFEVHPGKDVVHFMAKATDSSTGINEIVCYLVDKDFIWDDWEAGWFDRKNRLKVAGVYDDIGTSPDLVFEMRIDDGSGEPDEQVLIMRKNMSHQVGSIHTEGRWIISWTGKNCTTSW